MIAIHTFKENEKEEGKGRPQLGGQWKVLSLVVDGSSNVWLPLKGEGKTSFSLFFIFPPKKFYLNLLALIFKVLLYHGYRLLLYIFPSISLTYKLQSCISIYQIWPNTLVMKILNYEKCTLILKLNPFEFNIITF